MLARFVSVSGMPDWGILLASAAAISEVRQHLRRFLLVGMPNGGEVYFRFYDPRVLSIFLPTCSIDQLATFFGPIDAYWTLSEDAASYREHRLADGRLVTRRHAAKDGLPTDLREHAIPERNRGPA